MNQYVYETGHQMGKSPKPVVCIILGFFPIVGLCLIACSIFASYSVIAHDGYPVGVGFLLFAVIGGTGFGLLVIGWQFITVGLARYRFTKEGVYAKYPLKTEQLLPWRSFQQVCVCYSAYTTRGKRKANTIICCVKCGERRNIYGRWKTENPFRYRNIVCIEYTPGLYEGIKDMCPYTVIDLRETKEYEL